MTKTLIGRLPGTVSAAVRHHPVMVASTVAAATVGMGVWSVARHRRDADLELLAGTDGASLPTVGSEGTAP